MSKTAIEFDGVGKMYRLGRVGTGTLSHDLNRWWQTTILRREDPYLKIGQTNDRSSKGNSDYVWALRDISFKVEQGDVVGIIGKNGAGKSTLLKLLSHITAPTTGSIRYKGRIASLLEVGTGFHPEMTGRENIYMNGSIMGMTKAEITRKLDEIVDFAGIERYLDTPVKRYSSGMTVRLGFAVAAHLEPEILVVDEVLAVGDAEFQKKAIGKMQDVSKGEGRTVLFVSHNMAAVRSLCKRGIVLQNGMQVFDGNADDAVDYYFEKNENKQFKTSTLIEDFQRDLCFDRELEITEVSTENDVLHMATDIPLVFNIKVKKNQPHIRKFTVGLHIRTLDNETVGTYVSPISDVPEDKDTFSVRLRVNNHNLSKGTYFLHLNVGLKDVALGNRDYDVVHNVLSFKVIDYTAGSPISLWYKNWGHILLQNVDMCINDKI